MSLVVAIKKDDVVYLGADTRTTRGERVRSNLAEEDQDTPNGLVLRGGCRNGSKHSAYDQSPRVV